MRRYLPTIALLASAACALPSAPALAGTGGADVPPSNGPVTADGGGAVFKRVPKITGGPVLRAFSVSATAVTFRIEAPRRLRDVRVYVLRAGASQPVSTLKLGKQPRRITKTVALGSLAEGSYTVKVGAKDTRGRRLRRAPGIAAVGAFSVRAYRFPVAGPFSFGGEGARFGAGRTGYRHQGQDLPAAQGTPVVAPRGGTVKAVQYQAGGAGHYVVVSGSGEDRDYVFMHLQAGSIVVRKGQRVGTGQQIGRVGDTGRSSGPNLHFEIWIGGGWYSGGKPVDPLPFLRAWST